MIVFRVPALFVLLAASVSAVNFLRDYDAARASESECAAVVKSAANYTRNYADRDFVMNALSIAPLRDIALAHAEDEAKLGVITKDEIVSRANMLVSPDGTSHYPSTVIAANFLALRGGDYEPVGESTPVVDSENTDPNPKPFEPVAFVEAF